MKHNSQYYIDKVRTLQCAIRDNLLTHLREQEATTNDVLSGVADVRGGDTIYRIDAHSEEILFEFCDEWAKEAPFVLIAEGIEGNGWRVFPDGANIADASFLMIVDPIDGTRNIMYNKRSAWVLTGVAPNRGTATTLADIECAVMTEIPTTRHFLSDQLWAAKGQGANREAQNLLTGETTPLPLLPSRTTHLAHGFSSLAKFFPPAKAAMAGFEETLLARVAPNEGENPVVFDDQYMCTGGQIYEILVGHDRFIADLRPVFFEALGLSKKLVCHPYDICIELIAREAGVIITNEKGEPLSDPLDIQAPISWLGYANIALQDLIQPHFQELLSEFQKRSAP